MTGAFRRAFHHSFTKKIQTTVKINTLIVRSTEAVVRGKKKVVLKHFAIFRGKYTCVGVSFNNNVAGLRRY